SNGHPTTSLGHGGPNHSVSNPVSSGVLIESSPLSELLMNPALAAKRITIAPGKVLYGPSSEARSLFFVHRGQIRTYRIDDQANGRLLEILGPDDWCGEAALARQPQYG